MVYFKRWFIYQIKTNSDTKSHYYKPKRYKIEENIQNLAIVYNNGEYIDVSKRLAYSEVEEIEKDIKPECNPKLKKWVNIVVLPIKYLWYYSVTLGLKIGFYIAILLIPQDNEGCN